MALAFRETPEFIRGHSAELLVAELLQGWGWFINPAYAYTGEEQDKAPRLMGLERSYVIPDLDCASSGERAWVEVKLKAAPTFYRALQREEHGIDARHLASYRDVQSITGNSVWLVIVEESTGAVLAASIDTLGQDIRYRDNNIPGYWRMAYFPRDLLVPIEGTVLASRRGAL